MVNAEVPTKWYDEMDMKAGVRRLENHTQRLAGTRVRRERARERLHQVCVCVTMVFCIHPGKLFELEVAR